MEEILLNVESKELGYAYLKNGILKDLIIERKKATQVTGNIYKGRVTNILQNIQSAFIDINEDNNGFIHISDILENTKKFEQMFDMDFNWNTNSEKSSSLPKKEKVEIKDYLRINQPVLVQVIKEPIGSKGARLTSKISIAGRYMVLLPNSPHSGVSRKIESLEARERLKKIIRSFNLPKEIGVICRTASQTASPQTLLEEVTELIESWNSIIEKFNAAEGATCLYQESTLIRRAVINAINKKMGRILVDDYNTYQMCKKIAATYAEEHPLKIELYRDKIPIFERFNVEKEIEKSLKNKVWLPSGGYLFIDRTEAMHTIDVNSGRSGSVTDNVEESIVNINLEAVAEIVRQLRIRNIGGLIICDFIDMHLKRNQKRVLDSLKNAIKEDPSKCTILNMSEFGLIEMTRQRNRESLAQTILMPCAYCHGSGLIKNHETVAINLERDFKKVVLKHQQYALSIAIHPELDNYLVQTSYKEGLLKLAEKLNCDLKFSTKENLHINDYHFYSTITKKRIMEV